MGVGRTNVECVRGGLTTWITVVILELIHAQRPDFGRAVFIRFKADIFW